MVGQSPGVGHEGGRLRFGEVARYWAGIQLTKTAADLLGADGEPLKVA